jgi:hypothetical protein
VRKATMLTPHNLALLVIIILNQLNIKKHQIDKDNFRKKTCGENTIGIHSNL